VLGKGGHPLIFLGPLPLVRYLEIVLPLCAGPLFSKIGLSTSAGSLFRHHYSFRSALAALPLVRYSATAIFSIVQTFNVVFSFSNKFSTSSQTNLAGQSL
jgi:hypothetical protein